MNRLSVASLKTEDMQRSYLNSDSSDRAKIIPLSSSEERLYASGVRFEIYMPIGVIVAIVKLKAPGHGYHTPALSVFRSIALIFVVAAYTVPSRLCLCYTPARIT